MDNEKFKYEYPSLATLSLVSKVIGIIIIIVSIIGLIYGLTLLNGFDDEKKLGVYVVISSLISGLIFSLPFLAFAELMKLFARIEWNTRKESTIYKSQHQTGSSESIDNSFEAWKKENPTKSLTDFFSEMSKSGSKSNNVMNQTQLETNSSESTDKPFEEWKKENPTKTMTDYYAALIKKDTELKEARKKTNP